MKKLSVIAKTALAVILALSMFLSSCSDEPAKTTGGKETAATTGGDTKVTTVETPDDFRNIAFNDEKKTASLSLYYDDRFDFGELTDITVKSQAPTSKKVGKNETDTAVIAQFSGSKYVATAVGTAELTVKKGGVEYVLSLEVTPAPISMILVTGHSVGSGSRGAPKKSVAVEAGLAYSSFGGIGNVESDSPAAQVTKLATAGDFTGLGYSSEDRIEYGDNFDPDSLGVPGIDGAFAYKWIELTGEKVWVVNGAVGSSFLENWQPTGAKLNGIQCYEYALSIFMNAEKVMKNEVAAGHYIFNHMLMFNFSCANGDQNYETAKYYSQFETMWSSFKKDLALDINGDGKDETVESIGLVPICSMAVINYTSYHENPLVYSNGKICNAFLAASAAYPDVYMAADNYKDWSVSNVKVQVYFRNADISYPTHGVAVVRPTTREAVFYDGVHFQQVGYNDVGFECAENALLFLEHEAPDSATFRLTDGKTEVTTLDMLKGSVEQVVVVPEGNLFGEFEFATASGISFDKGNIKGLEAGKWELEVKAKNKVIATLIVNVTERPTARNFKWDFSTASGLSTIEGSAANKILEAGEGKYEIKDNALNNTKVQANLDTSIVLSPDRAWKVSADIYYPNDAAGSFLADNAQLKSGRWSIWISLLGNVSITRYEGSQFYFYMIPNADFVKNLPADYKPTDRHVYTIQNDPTTETISYYLDGNKMGDFVCYQSGSGTQDPSKQKDGKPQEAITISSLGGSGLATWPNSASIYTLEISEDTASK